MALLTALFGPRRDETRLAHALRTVPLFRDVPVEDLVAIWRCLQEVRAPAGSVICERDAPGDCMYIVQAGEFVVRLGLDEDAVHLRRGGPGDIVGEMALLTGAPRSADVVVVADAVLWSLERTDFESVMSRSPSLARALNRQLAERLARTTQLLEQRSPTTGRGPAGLRFGPFRVVEQLGAGGMAAVYSAVHNATETSAALKVLPAAWGAAPELRARLQREADALRSIDHPNVVKVLAVGEVEAALGGGCFIALEWLPQGLDRVLRAQFPESLRPETALRIAHGVAAGLAATHEVGLLHRDVKPSNVMLRADGTPVLTDFGLACALAETAAANRLTPSNVIVGTADYMAPEQIEGGQPDARSDIYGLGVVMYEMLTGQVPFAGRDPMQTFRAHREEAPPPLPLEVPAPFAAIVATALRKRPDDRFESAGAMGEAIEAALGRERLEERV
jgi:eukaryotic-like serine/threonine-protein kinase